MSKVAVLAEARADKTGDCREWTAADCLRSLLREIEDGTVEIEQLSVHFVRKERPDGRRLVGVRAAGVTYPEHITLLNVALANLLDDYRNKD